MVQLASRWVSWTKRLIDNPIGICLQAVSWTTAISGPSKAVLGLFSILGKADRSRSFEKIQKDLDSLITSLYMLFSGACRRFKRVVLASYVAKVHLYLFPNITLELSKPRLK